MTPAANEPTTTQQVFDPTDSKYQKYQDFLPDKESIWNYPKEKDGWVYIHNSIRGDLEMIEECLRAVHARVVSSSSSSGYNNHLPEAWEVAAVEKLVELHHSMVHKHHTHEDDKIAPGIARRVNLPAKLTDDHQHLVRDLNDIRDAVVELKKKMNQDSNDVSTSLSTLVEKWNKYHVDMKEHLQEEEDIALPLLRAYFTPKEYAELRGDHQEDQPTKLEAGYFAYYNKDTFSDFMKQEKIPFFVWYLAFAPGIRLYEKEIIALKVALLSGTEPLVTKKRLSLFWVAMVITPVVGAMVYANKLRHT